MEASAGAKLIFFILPIYYARLIHKHREVSVMLNKLDLDLDKNISVVNSKIIHKQKGFKKSFHTGQ